MTFKVIDVGDKAKEYYDLINNAPPYKDMDEPEEDQPEREGKEMSEETNEETKTFGERFIDVAQTVIAVLATSAITLGALYLFYLIIGFFYHVSHINSLVIDIKHQTEFEIPGIRDQVDEANRKLGELYRHTYSTDTKTQQNIDSLKYLIERTREDIVTLQSYCWNQKLTGPEPEPEPEKAP
ncbi:MAG: hypothetical protein ACYTBJ_01100 [Planctomycetota bacterium]|jgi:hypothetical protein